MPNTCGCTIHGFRHRARPLSKQISGLIFACDAPVIFHADRRKWTSLCNGIQAHLAPLLRQVYFLSKGKFWCRPWVTSCKSSMCVFKSLWTQTSAQLSIIHDNIIDPQRKLQMVRVRIERSALRKIHASLGF